MNIKIIRLGDSFLISLSHALIHPLSHSLTLSVSYSLTLSLSHSLALSISHSLSLDMLNNFCFHVYAQKSLFKVENVNGYFLTSSSSAAASAPREFVNHRAGSQLKMTFLKKAKGHQKRLKSRE